MSATTVGQPAAPELRYSLMELAETLPDVISLGRGDPDMHTPPEIVDAGVSRLRAGLSASPVQGHPLLRQAIAERYRRDKGIVVDPDRGVLVTTGAQEGLFLALLALIDPGDGVLIPDPRYASYDQAIEAAGGRLIEVPTTAESDFQLRAANLAPLADTGRLLIFVNPNNPTGSLVAADEVAAIAAVAREHRLMVLSDEIYESLTYDGAEVQSVMALEGMRERTVTLSGFSKTYAMTGFRVGYLLGPAAFIDAAARIKDAVSGPCPLFSQAVAFAALTGSRAPMDALRATFAARRRVMTDGLTAAGVPYSAPGGGFYIWADISAFGLPAADFCRRLLIEQQVLMFPGSAFGAKWSGYVRISLLQPEERLREAVARIRRFLDSVRGERQE